MVKTAYAVMKLILIPTVLGSFVRYCSVKHAVTHSMMAGVETQWNKLYHDGY
jgi:hypothetical protein